MAIKRELAAAEDAGWEEVCALVEALSLEEVERPGLVGEWSVKDLMAHLGAWQAEAVHILEQIRFGTYRALDHDVEDLNRRFREANRDLPSPVVRAEMSAARTRMIQEWNALQEVTPAAEEWFRESGPAHYEEHLPRLREWVRELRSLPSQG